MMWAKLDDRKIVVEILEQDSRPDGSVKIPNGVFCSVGLVWTGWEFRHSILTAYQFINRFTTSELDAILFASKTDPIVLRFLCFAQSAQEIDLGDPMTVSGTDYLVSVGLLASARRDEILQN